MVADLTISWCTNYVKVDGFSYLLYHPLAYTAKLLEQSEPNISGSCSRQTNFQVTHCLLTVRDLFFCGTCMVGDLILATSP